MLEEEEQSHSEEKVEDQAEPGGAGNQDEPLGNTIEKQEGIEMMDLKEDEVDKIKEAMKRRQQGLWNQLKSGAVRRNLGGGEDWGGEADHLAEN